MKPLLFCLLATIPLCAQDTEVTVDLRNPIYKQGALYTDEGGVIKNQDIRIQARTIQYFNRIEDGKQVHRIEAEGDLMIQYKGRVYVGSELEYDFEEKTGIVYEGKTFSSMWYIGGDKIQLNPDGSYKATNAFITTCENRDSSWDFHAHRIHVIKDHLFEAKKIRFRCFKIPTFWLPSLRLNLKKFKEPIFRYYAKWDSGVGPKAGIRYQLYSWQDFALYGRLEYRLRKGWGGAFETEYFPEHKQTSFVTRSYLGKDTLDNAPNPAIRRYRLQGAFNHLSEKTKTILTWDKYSDVRMPGDFRSDDFEVNTANQTQFYVRHQEKNGIASFKVRPRVNSFESIKQDLPTLFAITRPVEIGPSGIILSNRLKASYVDFAYSDKLIESLSDYRSVRVEVIEKIYRPLHLGPLTLTPHFGAVGIFYGNSPDQETKNLGLLGYGAKAHFHGTKNFGPYKHVFEPYIEYKALSRPTVGPDEHYIFSIQDGYQKIQQIEIGARNLLRSLDRSGKEPDLTASLYANAFFSDPVIPQVVPRGYLDLAWRLPSIHFTFNNCWNFRNEVLDFSNARFKWTISEDIALSLEARYRSQYDWRKADHQNFILDVSRSESELLLSPLSDKRVTFLTNLFIRPSPFWEWHIQSHHGFLRENQKPYNEVKINLSTWISAAWKLRLSYSYTMQGGSHVSAGINLVKK